MKKFILFISLLFGFVSVSLADLQAATDLNQLLQKFSTYQADFSQVTVNSEGKVLQRNRGKVSIMRPGKFRWETEKPQQVIITNGNTLWIYDVDLEQATVQPLHNRVRVNPVSLLSGSISDLTHEFEVTQLKNKSYMSYRLHPKKEGDNFKSIQLNFLNSQLVSMKVINNLDQTTVFSFVNIKINMTLPATLFEFKAPPGVDVIRQ